MAVEGGKRDYGKVVISLENVVLPEEKLIQTPSRIDGLDEEVEIDLRIVGCEYIQMAGILLKLPQVAMATGQVLFQRFYYSKSFVKHDAEVYAMACIFLAAKIEEAPRRVRDVINVFHHIKQKRNNRPVSPMEYLGNQYYNLKNLVIKAERRLLKELGFCVHVKHPHKIIFMYLQILESEKNQALAQKAWNYMNDSLRSSVFVRYPPECIACACIFLSSRQLGVCLPLRPPWWELFDARLEDLENISRTLLELQLRPKVSLDSLQKRVGEVQKKIRDQKAQSKQEDQAGGATPPTPASQPSSKPGSRAASPSRSVTRTSSPDQEDDGKKLTEKERANSNNNKQRSPARPSRSPEGGPSRSRSKSRSPNSPGRFRSRSRSASRSPSYSLSISPGSLSHSADSDSSQGSPAKSRPQDSRQRRRRSPPRDKYRSRKRDSDAPHKALSGDAPNAYKRSRERRRSRSPPSPGRSRSRSRSRERAKRQRAADRYERDRRHRRDDRRRGDRNGVDQRAQEKRAHRRHRR